MKDGSAVCWGANHFGEATPNSGDFVQVSCGSSSTCGLRQNGLVECWGKNDMGQSTPPTNKVYKQISSSLNKHVCGIEHDTEDVSCWGSNIREQVRLGERRTYAVRKRRITTHCVSRRTHRLLL